MKQIKRIPVTKEGFEKLQNELKKLLSERPAAVKTLAEARAMGDLSENGLYTAAKARLRSIDNEIFRFEIQIKLADIKEAGSKTVGIGSEVIVSNNNVKTTYKIVGDYEANPFEKKISQHSPLGRALIGRKEGDVVDFESPKGITSYTVESVT